MVCVYRQPGGSFLHKEIRDENHINKRIYLLDAIAKPPFRSLNLFGQVWKCRYFKKLAQLLIV